MARFVPTHARFIVSTLLGALSSARVWILVLSLGKREHLRFGDFLAYEILITAVSIIVLVAIGWPIFAIFRRSGRVNFRIAVGMGLVTGLLLGVFSGLGPLDGAWFAASACAGAAGAGVSWWWSYRPVIRPSAESARSGPP